MYQITGRFTTRKFLSSRTDPEHVYYTSAMATTLEEAVLEAINAGADLSTAHGAAKLDRVNLPGADLRGANLDSCRMYRANFRRANLAGANLKGNLTFADLTEANLFGARLGDIREANLSGAILSRATFEGPVWGARLQGADVSEARVDQQYLNHANFTDCDNLGELVVVLTLPQTRDQVVLSRPQYYLDAHEILTMPGLGGANWRAILRARGQI